MGSCAQQTSPVENLPIHVTDVVFKLCEFRFKFLVSAISPDLFFGFFKCHVRIAVVTEHPMDLGETRDVPSDVFSSVECMIVAVVSFSQGSYRRRGL